MSLIWFLQLLSLGAYLNADICGGEATTCNPAFTWFGTPCRYKCHCTNNSCDSNGECTQSSVCENGWFGPSCQYTDLVSTYATLSTPYWVYDLPDTLCSPGQESVNIYFNRIFYFTWLRLRANAPVGSQDFLLHLMNYKGNAVECSNMYTSRFNDTILDIHCQPGAVFKNLIIMGEGVKSLCSVYISGGRNVALGQATLQSSNFLNYFSRLAVDGNNNSFFEHGSCSHTGFDSPPSWTLTFERPHHVNRYVIYNRNSHQRRLLGFILEAYQDNKYLALIYISPTDTSDDIYRIQSNPPHLPVSEVIITATYKDVDGIFLTLCEVEMFDAVCPALKYGRECEKTCNCANIEENCFVSTGGCPSGCAVGYQGEGCRNPCNKGYHGMNCSQKCSTDCLDQLCQPTNGTCLSCMPGKHGLLCNKVLPDVDPDESLPIAMIGGLVVAFLVLVTLIAVGVFIWRRSRHNIDEHERTTPHELQNFTEIDNSRNMESKAGTAKPHTVVSDKQRIQKVPTNRTAATATAQSFQYQDNDSNTYITPYNAYETAVGSSSLIGTSRELEAEYHGTYSEDTSTDLYENMDNHPPNPYETIDETESDHVDYISDK